MGPDHGRAVRGHSKGESKVLVNSVPYLSFDATPSYFHLMTK